MFKDLYPEKLHVSFYPYTYVRVMAKKGKLYKKQDYDKMLKMHGNEIAAYLETGDYKEDILSLGKTLSGYALVENALHTNLIRHLRDLQRISSPEMNYLLRAYVHRHDIYNLKTLLRAKTHQKSFSEIESLLLPIGTFSKEKLSILSEMDSPAIILKGAGFSERDFREALAYYDKEKSLAELENFLDKAYYKFLFDFLSHLAGEHELFKELLQTELDVLNVKILLRMKKRTADEKQITSFFFAGGALFSQSRLRNLASQDFSQIISVLKNTSLQPAVNEHISALQEQNLHGFEKSLDVWLHQKSTRLLHQFPLSVDTLLGYMFAKDLEVRNLRIIVKGKQLGMQEEYIASQLVIAS